MFLAQVAHTGFTTLVQSTTTGSAAWVVTALDAIAVAATAASRMLCAGVVAEVCTWVTCVAKGTYGVVYGRIRGRHTDTALRRLLVLPSAATGVAVVLANNATLTDMSRLLKAPVSALVMSSAIR